MDRRADKAASTEKLEAGTTRRQEPQGRGDRRSGSVVETTLEVEARRSKRTDARQPAVEAPEGSKRIGATRDNTRQESLGDSAGEARRTPFTDQTRRDGIEQQETGLVGGTKAPSSKSGEKLVAALGCQNPSPRHPAIPIVAFLYTLKSMFGLNCNYGNRLGDFENVFRNWSFI